MRRLAIILIVIVALTGFYVGPVEAGFVFVYIDDNGDGTFQRTENVVFLRGTPETVGVQVSSATRFVGICHDRSEFVGGLCPEITP